MYKLLLLVCTSLTVACTHDVASINHTPLERVNNHLQHTYKLNINKFTLTGEVTQEPTGNLNRTYTILKLEY